MNMVGVGKINIISTVKIDVVEVSGVDGLSQNVGKLLTVA